MGLLSFLEEKKEPKGILAPKMDLDMILDVEPQVDVESVIQSTFGAEAALMRAIAMGESSMDRWAHNQKGEDSIGLFQINWDVWGKGGEYDSINKEAKKVLGRDLRKIDLFDPEINILAAKVIRDKQGLNAWSAFKDKSYRKHLNP